MQRNEAPNTRRQRGRPAYLGCECAPQLELRQRGAVRGVDVFREGIGAVLVEVLRVLRFTVPLRDQTVSCTSYRDDDR